MGNPEATETPRPQQRGPSRTAQGARLIAYPSTFLDIQNAVTVKARLNTADLAKVRDWINQVYAHVCVEVEARVTSATFTLAGGTSTYDLSTFAPNVSRLKEIAIQPVGSFYGPPLKPVSLEQILEWRQTSAAVANTNGTSTHYALLGLNDLELYPTPATADTILIYYVALPVALSANGDIPILGEPYASRVLEYGALVQAGEFKGDPMTMEWQQSYENWLQRFRGHLNRRRGTGTMNFRVVGRQMVVPHDPGVDTGR